MLPRLTIASISPSVSGIGLSFLPVTLAAPLPANSGFRPPNSGRAPGFPTRLSAALFVIEIKASFPSFHVPPFIDWSGRLLWLLLTSAEHEGTAISAPLHRISPSAGRQTSPGNARDLPPIYPPHLLPRPPDGYWALSDTCLLARLWLPRMRFLFVGPGFCLRLPSDSGSLRTPLPSG